MSLNHISEWMIYTLPTKKINELVGLSPSFDWYRPVVVHHACLRSSLSKHPNNNQPLGVENIMVYRCFRGGWSTRRLQTTTWINNWLLFLLESISITISFRLRGTSIRYEPTSFDCCRWVVVHRACLDSCLGNHLNNNQPFGVEDIIAERCSRGGWSSHRDVQQDESTTSSSIFRRASMKAIMWIDIDGPIKARLIQYTCNIHSVFCFVYLIASITK